MRGGTSHEHRLQGEIVIFFTDLDRHFEADADGREQLYVSFKLKAKSKDGEEYLVKSFDIKSSDLNNMSPRIANLYSNMNILEFVVEFLNKVLSDKNLLIQFLKEFDSPDGWWEASLPSGGGRRRVADQHALLELKLWRLDDEDEDWEFAGFLLTEEDLHTATAIPINVVPVNYEVVNLNMTTGEGGGTTFGFSVAEKVNGRQVHRRGPFNVSELKLEEMYRNMTALFPGGVNFDSKEGVQKFLDQVFSLSGDNEHIRNNFLRQLQDMMRGAWDAEIMNRRKEVEEKAKAKAEAKAEAVRRPGWTRRLFSSSKPVGEAL